MSLISRINEIPGEDGWWKSSTGQTFRKISKELKDYGTQYPMSMEIRRNNE